MTASNLDEETLAPGVDDEHVESVLLRWKKPSVDACGTAPAFTPPPAVLSILDAVFDGHRAQLPTVKDIRRSPSTAELAAYLRLPHRAPGLVDHLLDGREPHRALWVLQIATESGYTFSHKFYGQVAEKLAELKKWRLIPRVVRMAKKHLGYTTTGLLNWRLQALMECQHYISLDDALDMFAKEQVRASRLTYHLVIAMHLRNHDLAGALATVRAMESAGFRLNARTWAVILLSHRSLGLTQSAKEQALTVLETADGPVATAILNSLVQLLLDVHDMRGVVDILAQVSQAPEDPVSRHGADSTPEDDDFVGALERPPAHPSHPRSRRSPIDVSTYNILLNYLARRGDLTRSMETLEQMRSANIAPDGATATALVRLYFAADRPNDALHIVADSLRDFPTTAPLLHRLGFSAAFPSGYPTYPRVASPTIDLFNALIFGVLRTSGLNGLNTALRIMRIARVDANTTTLAIFLSYLHRTRSPRPREMIMAVRALMSAGIAPTTKHLHVVMAALLREERFSAHPRGWAIDSPSQETPHHPSADGPPSDGDDYADPVAGIAISSRLRYRNLLRPIIQSLRARGVRNDKVVYAMRIKHDAVVKRDLEQAHASFREMVNAGMRPNEFHYGALMEGYTAAGDMARATDLMREASDAGAKIDVKTHTILIAGFARQAQPTAAVEAFRRMVAEGIRPDVPAIDALVSAFFRARAYGMARRVLLQLWPQVGPMPEELIDAPLRQLAVAFRELHGSKRRPPGRLSSQEQRMLRWKIRDILRSWTGAPGHARKKGEVQRRVRHVPSTRTPEYTREEGC